MNMQTRIKEDLQGFRELSGEAFYGIPFVRSGRQKISVQRR